MRRTFLMRGRPARSLPAKGPMPTFVLMLHEETALRRVRRAGAEGVVLGDGLSLSTAIRLALLGYVVIDKSTPQRLRPVYGAQNSRRAA